MSFITLDLNSCFEDRPSRAAQHVVVPPHPRREPGGNPATPLARAPVATLVAAGAMLSLPAGLAAQTTEPDFGATSVTLSVNPSSVGEDAGSTSVTVTATADAAVSAATAVTVSVGGGSATSGEDYGSVSDFTVTIPRTRRAGSLSVTGTSLTLTDEEEVTAEWWFGANLSVSPGSVSENGGSQLVTVTAEVSEWGTSSSDLTYVVTVGKGGDSAVSGTDYKAVSKFNVIIKSGRRSGSNSFYLEPIADTAWEGDETITIHASGPDGAQSATLTLTDEGDRPYSGPQVTLSANRRR